MPTRSGGPISDASASIPVAHYSCHSSLNSGEPLWAHATRVHTWLALGHPGPWGAKALAECDLPAAVKSKLTAFEQTGPHGRVQFIRQAGDSPGGAIPLLLARSDGDQPWLRQFTLGRYEELLAMDLEALVSQPPMVGEALSEPILLVCVNGKRDLCCALYGQGVFDTLAQLAPERVWQTTHLGGHRFAATAVLLPFGVHYGRLRPEDAPDLLAATDEGELLLSRVRGFTVHDEPAQAADFVLRKELNLRGIQALHWLSTEPQAEGGFVVHFENRQQGGLLKAHVAPSEETYRVYTTTGDPAPDIAGHFRVQRLDS